MKIEIAGPGCARCKATEKVVQEVCDELKLDAEISHIYDVREFLKLGVRITPAVILNGKIVISGKVPTKEELKKILLEEKK
jgi:small redox-active disulfide protein 2